MARVAGALRASASAPGDRVVAYMPNMPQTVIAFLACASIGAVWSSCSPDMGADARARPLPPDRAQGAVRGRRLPLQRQVASTGAPPVEELLAQAAHACERVVPARAPERATRPRGRPARSDWNATCEGRRRAARASSCGCRSTTRCGSSTPPAPPGLPKAIVHGHGGIVLTHLKTPQPCSYDLRRRRPHLLFPRAPAGSCGTCWSAACVAARTVVLLRRQPGLARRRARCGASSTSSGSTLLRLRRGLPR